MRRLIGAKTATGVVLHDDTALASHFLEAFGVASVPGAAFGAPGFIRLSIAASQEQLDGACDRLARMAESLRR